MVAHVSPLDPKWTCIGAYCCGVCVAQPLTFWDHALPWTLFWLSAQESSAITKILLPEPFLTSIDCKKGHEFGEAWGPGWASSECPLLTCRKRRRDLWGVLTLENLFLSSHQLFHTVAELGICLEPLLALPSLPLPQSPTQHGGVCKHLQPLSSYYILLRLWHL